MSKRKYYIIKSSVDLNDAIEKINAYPEERVILNDSGVTLENITHITKILTQSTVTDLSCCCLYIGTSGAKDIANALKNNKTLKILELSANQICDDGAKDIANALKNNKTLKTLELNGNQISDEGAKYIAEFLKENSALTKLGLGGNEIGYDGAKDIASALKNNKTLITLDLSVNKMGSNGARVIIKSLQDNYTLSTLLLSHNDITEKGAKKIATLIKNNHALIVLDLGVNGISNNVLKEIYDHIRYNKEYVIDLANFLYDNDKEIMQGYNGNLDNLIVKKIPSFSCNSKRINREDLEHSKGVFSFFSLFPKISKSFLKEYVDLIGKFDVINDSIESFMAANFFKSVCKNSSVQIVKESGESAKVDHILKLPICLLVQITKGLPFPTWNYNVFQNDSSDDSTISGENFDLLHDTVL